MRLFDTALFRDGKQSPTPLYSRRIPGDQTGIKRWYMVGPLDNIVKTPYGAKELRRRRAANRAAKQARKANRG